MEAGSSKKAKWRKGNDPVGDSDVERWKSCDDACESPGVDLTDRK